MMSTDENGPTSPRRHLLKRRRAEVLNILPEDEEDSRNSDDDGEDIDANPLPDREKGRQGQVSVKEALEGLFSSGTIHSSTRELIVVKRYSHGKTFRQRLSYIVFKHTKTSRFLRYIGLILNLASVLLYIAEAIFIDVLLFRDNVVVIDIPCFNLTRNYTEPNVVDLLLIPKPIELWGLQVILALVSLLGASFAVYVRQEFHGSLLRHFRRNFDIHILLTVLLGLAFLVTVFSPCCLHHLFIPSFLYCWPARFHLLFIVVQNNQGSYFRQYTGLRTTAVSLGTFIVCFFVSCVCVIHHFERLGFQINLFNTCWYTVVTFSTVGYGDVYPGHWTGKFFMILFIVSALIYLPTKAEKLWNSVKLHRKHHSQFQKRSSVKHVVMIAVSLKPLVLHDFINEFYSDPNQMDTQCVILVEEEIVHIMKQMLNHPVWSKRITVILGSGLKVSDLARVKARSAEACFIRTVNTTGSSEEADRHTILCAWTMKSYAPKCKLYVHIIRPENKMHLHIADEIVCERELTNSVLALNTICPGMSTIISLLVHTFTYEGRGYNHSDYQLYEKFSPSEIYHIRLDQSRYFHHFAGKNFMFSAVVAYRKFHVVLLGVRPSDADNIIFNPGVNHIMNEGDTCYYISETKEEYSDYQIVKPTCFQAGLWDTSATLGLLSLHLADIDPEKIIAHSREEEEEEGKMSQRTTILKRMMSNQSERQRKISSNSLDQSPVKTLDRGQMFVGLQEEEEDDDDICSLDPQITAEVCNWQKEAQVGLQLLKYHGSHMNKPVVKLSVVPKPHCTENRSVLLPCSSAATFKETNLGTISEAGTPDVIVVEKFTDEEDIYSTKSKAQSHPAVLSFLHRPTSHEGHPPHPELMRRSSSFLKLGSTNAGDSASLLSGISSVASNKSAASQTSHAIDPLVMLELDNISEKEELEDLEEGRTHPIQLPLIEEETKSLHSPSEAYGSHTHSPSFQFIKGHIPVLPYCGCEPLHCYLQHQRSLAEIQINSTTICDQLKCQWHEKAILVYADQSSPGLFHFVAPLRARCLPQSSLKPIVFILGSQPDRNFLSVIAELPLVYFLVGSLRSISDLIRAGIMCADSLVVLSPSDASHRNNNHELLADAENIASLHKIARLFPHIRLSVDFTFRYNIRFLYTTPYEQWSLQHLRQMARKGDHLTYLFLPQVASGKAFSSSMFDTLLYQAYQKPHIINVFRQLIGCLDVEGSGFLWKVSVTDELLKLNTYVRVFQRLASTLGYIPIGVYRTSRIATKFDVKGFSEHELENLRVFLQGRLHSLGLQDEVPKLLQPQHQHFVYVNPSPDFQLQTEDIILVIRPPATKAPASSMTTNSTKQMGLNPSVVSPSPVSMSSVPVELEQYEEEPRSNCSSQSHISSRPTIASPHSHSRSLIFRSAVSPVTSYSLSQHNFADTEEL